MHVSRDQVHIKLVVTIHIIMAEEGCHSSISERCTSFERMSSTSHFNLLNYHLSGCLIICLDVLCSQVKTKAVPHFDLYPQQLTVVPDGNNVGFAMLKLKCCLIFECIFHRDAEKILAYQILNGKCNHVVPLCEVICMVRKKNFEF